MNSIYIHITIHKPYEQVYAFLREPANFPAWASGLASGAFTKADNGLWLAETPMGKMHLRFSPANDYGICDHWVIVPEGEEMYNPMRVIANGDGCDVVFTLFQRPGMSHEDMERDHAWVAKDFAMLKTLLES